jgi:hypothetical protein
MEDSTGQQSQQSENEADAPQQDAEGAGAVRGGEATKHDDAEDWDGEGDGDGEGDELGVESADELHAHRQEVATARQASEHLAEARGAATTTEADDSDSDVIVISDDD